MIVLLYSLVVLIWGSAWIAVKFQIGIVPAEASVAYRMGIAAFCMFAWVLAKRLPLRFSPRDHLIMALQGGLIFSTNFLFFYLAAGYMTTGLIAVVCSTSSGMIMLFNTVLLRRPPTWRVVLGALLGFTGISVIFLPEFSQFDLGSRAIKGLALSLAGTLCFAMGSVLAARNRRAGLSVRGNTAWGMFYGTLLLCVFTQFRGKPFAFDFAAPYLLSLAYLSLISSVIGFAAYFALLARIEPERAAYVTVLFPIVALGLSTLFESYQWTPVAFCGILLTLAGNILILHQHRRVVVT